MKALEEINCLQKKSMEYYLLLLCVIQSIFIAGKLLFLFFKFSSLGSREVLQI